MMKKSILKFLLCATAGLSSSAIYAANHSFKKVETCQYDYSDINFCSKSNIATYKQALKTQKANFAQKYILLNIGKASYRTYTAIDTETGIVYPLNFDIVGFKDQQGNIKRPAKIMFSTHQSDLCIEGGIESYRNSYGNVAVCFAVLHDNITGTEFTWVDTPQELD